MPSRPPSSGRPAKQSTQSHHAEPPVASTSQSGPHAAAGGSSQSSAAPSSSSPSSPQPAASFYMPSSYAHTHEMAHYLTSTFAPAVVPQPDEYLAKESARVYLEKLAERVSPGAKLLPFGSMANGFALKNSDMDLCCFLAKDAPMRAASELVETLGRLIEQETNFHVKMLPRARIPIIKLTMPPTSSVPFGMSCDIGFENRLALENTRLLLTYAMIDTRLRTLVLFLKVWTKRRKINNPYRGTLSSYGFVLLVIHFLAQVKNPPVLPNLQQLSPTVPVPLEELEFDGHDISFFDDLEALPQHWQTANGDNVGELLIDFFRYFSKDFAYNTTVISIRSVAGWLSKESKGWVQEENYDPDFIVRDQHKLCIEDPFQLDYNVARTVTRDGLYTIRGEFMRAYRLLSARPNDRIAAIINDVCEEREDYLVHHPPTDHRTSPRRRSAPSPRMFPNPALGLPHPPPLAATPSGTSPGSAVATMQDFRLWTAMNGVQQGHELVQNGAMPSALGLGTGAMDPRIFARDLTSTAPEGSALEEAWEGPLMTSTSTSPRVKSSSSIARSSSATPSSQLPSSTRHLSPVTSPTALSRPSQPLPSSSTGTSHRERRVSWDGSAPAVSSSLTGGYDLHRFFQNQPGDDTPAGGAAQQSPSPYHQLEPRSALTAPSSPDLGSSSYYTNHGLGGSSYNGRSTYRYGSSPAAGFSSVSRISGAPLRHPPYYQPHQQHAQQSWTIAPTPIFPEEDRETIAMANSITFGNFSSPSLGGRTATPSRKSDDLRSFNYVGGSVQASISTNAAGAIGPSGRSVDGINGDERRAYEEEAGRVIETEGRGERGRRYMNGTIVLPSQDDVGFGVNRQRGRSVPHTRRGPDGRESILFGEIQVVLPRPQGEDGRGLRGAREEDLAVQDEADLVEHVHTPASRPTELPIPDGSLQESSSRETTSASSETVGSAASSSGVQSVPLLTTQPPTPLKSAPSFTTFSPLPKTPLPQSPEILPFDDVSPFSSSSPPPFDKPPLSPTITSPLPLHSRPQGADIVAIDLSTVDSPDVLPPTTIGLPLDLIKSPLQSPPVIPLAASSDLFSEPLSQIGRSTPSIKRSSVSAIGSVHTLSLSESVDPDPKGASPNEKSKAQRKKERRKSSAAAAATAAAVAASTAARVA